jgi:hypothetical protein
LDLAAKAPQHRNGSTETDSLPSDACCTVKFTSYLKKQTLPEFALTFEQIAEIIDAALLRAA